MPQQILSFPGVMKYFRTVSLDVAREALAMARSIVNERAADQAGSAAAVAGTAAPAAAPKKPAKKRNRAKKAATSNQTGSGLPIGSGSGDTANPPAQA